MAQVEVDMVDTWHRTGGARPQPAEACSEFLEEADKPLKKRAGQFRSLGMLCLASFLCAVIFVAPLVAHFVAKPQAKPVSLGVLA